MKYKFNYMTTDLLEKAKDELKKAVENKQDELTYLRAEIKELRTQYRRAYSILKAREKSKYNGEYYIKSGFRVLYRKPYSDLSEEEKRDYHRKRYHKYYLNRKTKKSNNKGE